MKRNILLNQVGLIFLFMLSVIYAFGQTGNYVFSGGEVTNFGIIDLATPANVTWATERGATPGYFTAIGTASYTNPSDAYNINGYVKHAADAPNQSFSFPVGTVSDYRQLSVNGNRVASSIIGVAWIVGDPSLSLDPTAPAAGAHATTSFGSDIRSVSNLGQWDWQDLTNNASGVNVIVSIPDLSNFGAASELRLVGWNGSQWVNLSGTNGASGNTKNSTLNGTMINGITALGVGRAAAPDLAIAIGKPSLNLIANQPNDIPVTVSNIGTASTTGEITAIVEIPAGTTLGAFPANNNGWTCTANGTTATCKNPGPIANGASSNFKVPFIPTTAQVATTLRIPAAKVSGGGEPATNTANNSSGTIEISGFLGNSCPVLTNLSVDNVNPSACGGSNGSIKICGLVPNATGYTINYDKNGTSAIALTNQTADANGCIIIPNLFSGSYTNIKVTSNTCLSGSTPITAALADPGTATVSILAKSNPTVCGGNDGSLTLTGLSSGTTYTLSYSKDGNVQSPVIFTANSSNYVLGGLLKGDYASIRVTNNGCSSNSVAASLADPLAVLLTAGTSVNPTTCGSASGSISFSGLTTGTIYTIDYKRNGVSQDPISFVATAGNYTIPNLKSGLYTNITASNNNCISNSLSFSLSDPAGAVILTSAIVQQPTTCGSTGSVTINGLVNGSAYTLNYTKDGVAQVPLSFTASGTSYTLAALGAGKYEGITVSLAGGCTSNALSAVLYNPSTPLLIDVVATNAQTCSPGNEGALVISGLVPGINYTLNYSKDGVIQPSSQITVNGNSTSYRLPNLTKGTYSNINVSQTAGCVSNNVTVTIGTACAPDLLIAIAQPNPLPLLAGQTSNIPVTVSNNGTASTTGEITAVVEIPTGTAFGIFPANNNGWICTLSGTKATCKNPGPIANGASSNFKVPFVPAAQQIGTTLQIPSATVSGGGEPSANTTNNNSGTLTITGTVGADCPTVTNLSTNNVNPATCQGANGSIKICGLVANATGYTINYDKNGTSVTPITNQSADANGCLIISGLTAGSYTNIKITSANCSAGSNSLSANLADPVTANISIGAQSNPQSCGGNDGTFTISGLATGTSYTLFYDKDGSPQTPISFVATGVSYLVKDLVKGNYSAIRVSSTGCSSNSVSATLADPTATTISSVSSTNPTVCGASTGSITINGLASGTNYSIQYKRNGIFQAPISYLATSSSYTINGLTAGSYTDITVSNGACTSNKVSAKLSDPGAAVLALGTVIQPTACGTTDGSITITGLVTGSSYTLNYNKDGISQLPTNFTANGASYTLSLLGAGKYEGISVSQGGGCTSSALSAVLANPNGAIIDVIATDAKSCSPGNDGTLLITGLSQGQNYTLSYTKDNVPQTTVSIVNATTSKIITSLLPGSYSNITVTQSGGCISNTVNNVKIGSPAQAIAPTLSKSSVIITCPATTTDLNAISATNPQAGTSLSWHTGTPATAANKVAGLSTAVIGTYYATFYNANSNCYGATAAFTVTTTECTPILTITKEAQTGTIKTNTNFTYTLTVNNTGTKATSGLITIKDNLQANLIFVAGANTNGWTCSESNQLVTCTNSTAIPAGGSSSTTFTVLTNITGVYSNIAKVYGGGDPVAIDLGTAKQSNQTSTSVGVGDVKLTAKAFLTGSYIASSGTMTDNLRLILPLTQPYGKGQYTDFSHPGADEITFSSVLAVSGSNAIVDWVFIELRDKNNSANVLYNRSGLIQKDGDIVDVDGFSCLTFFGVPADNYYVAIRHRNHLGVMTASTIALTKDCSPLVDFTNPSTNTFRRSGELSKLPQSTIEPNVTTMWPGETTKNFEVLAQGSGNDRLPIATIILSDQGNTLSINNYILSGYYREDLNMDGNVILQGPKNDTNLLNTITFFDPDNINRLNNFIILQQLP